MRTTGLGRYSVGFRVSASLLFSFLFSSPAHHLLLTCSTDRIPYLCLKFLLEDRRTEHRQTRDVHGSAPLPFRAWKCIRSVPAAYGNSCSTHIINLRSAKRAGCLMQPKRQFCTSLVRLTRGVAKAPTTYRSEE